MVVATVPLWKQFYCKQKAAALNASTPEDKNDDLQGFYTYLQKQRQQQGIPPVFGMLTGPMIRPYRMEETKMVLGRITPSRRLASVHVGSLSKISHQHCIIEWDKTQGAYVLELLSPNGIQVGPPPPATSTSYYTPGTRVTLPNPCQLVIQTIPMFFQCFYVASEQIPEPEISDYLSIAQPMTTRSRSANPAALTSTEYREIITKALEELGGRGTQKEIAEIIERERPEVSQQKTWRNSVSGILSSSSAYSTAPAFLPSGKRARYSMWVLNSMKDDSMDLSEEQLSCGSVSLVSTDHQVSTDRAGEPPHKKIKSDHQASDSDSEMLQIDEGDAESDEDALRIDVE